METLVSISIAFAIGALAGFAIGRIGLTGLAVDLAIVKTDLAVLQGRLQPVVATPVITHA